MPSISSATPIRRCTIETTLGEMVLAATERGVCLCEFADRPALAGELVDLQRRTGAEVVDESSEHLKQLADELTRYLAGEPRAFTVPLDTPGPPFHRAVWDELLRIPYGTTTSYDDIARRLGNPNAQRAVGRANGANRVAIIIPCHRVIEKNGELRGYGGGLWRKKKLLELERARVEPGLFEGKISSP